MEDDGKTYILPHPTFARVIFASVGLFAFIMAPFELWRGVWPLNITSPFFGFIMLGGMSVGAAAIWSGICAPSAQLRFKSGFVELIYNYLWGNTRQVIRSQDIENYIVVERESDGANDWYAVMNVAGGNQITSRPLSSKEAAEKQLAEFQRLMG